MKTIQLISMVAAAGLIAGCSSTGSQSGNYTTTPNPPNGPSVDMSRNTDGTAGNSAYNFNQGSYNPPGAPGNEGKSDEAKTDVTIDQLPQAAQQSIRNQVGDQQIAKIKQETKDGQTAYRVELQRKDWYSMRPSLLVAADGAILKESHLQKINEAAGSQTPQSSSSMGSQANPSGDQIPQNSQGTPANPSVNAPRVNQNQ